MAEERTSSLAVAAGVVAIGGWFGLGPAALLAADRHAPGAVGWLGLIPIALVAVFLGHLGAGDLRRHPEARGRGWVRAALWLGYLELLLIVVALVAVYLLASGADASHVQNQINNQLIGP